MYPSTHQPINNDNNVESVDKWTNKWTLLHNSWNLYVDHPRLTAT